MSARPGPYVRGHAGQAFARRAILIALSAGGFSPLHLPVDAATLLPGDDSSEGFDNMASVLSVSPALMQAYVSAAAKISRLAVGDLTTTATITTYQAPRGLAQSGHREGMPLGTRGGILVEHVFPLDADYELRVGRGGAGFGLTAVGADEPVEITLDGRARAPDWSRCTARRRTAEDSRRPSHHRRRHRPQDQFIRCGRSVFGAGHQLGGSEPHYQWTAQPDRAWRHAEPPPDLHLPSRTPSGRSPVRENDSVIAGNPRLPASRQRRRPDDRHADGVLRIGPKAARLRDWNPVRAWRACSSTRSSSTASSASPPACAAGAVYRISDLELASRLSFFLWSSIPDEELLQVAATGRLVEPRGARAAGAAHAGRRRAPTR